MRNPALIALLDEIKDLHDAKSHDYAGADPLSNLRMCEAFGVPAWKGVLVRLSDKYSRLAQLAGGKTPKNESLRDTLIDNAVYSLLAINLLDEQEVVGDPEALPEYRPELGTQTVVFGGATYVPGAGEPDFVAVGPQGYVPAEHVRMSR